MKQLILILFCTLSCLCVSAKSAYSNPDLDELRFEIDDLKQALHVTQVDLSLLEELHKKQEGSLAKQMKESHNASSLTMQVNGLEKKISQLEKTLEKISTDLRTLNTALSQATNEIHQFQTQLSAQDERLNEVNKLKGTLNSIAKAVTDRSATSTPSSSSVKTYRVKAGDSLEKIARAHQTTAESIRKLNHLNHDKIIVGQELKVSNDPS